MGLFHQRLAFVKQRGLDVVVGKIFRLAAHLGLLFIGLQPRWSSDKTLGRTRLKWAAPPPASEFGS